MSMYIDGARLRTGVDRAQGIEAVKEAAARVHFSRVHGRVAEYIAERAMRGDSIEELHERMRRVRAVQETSATLFISRVRTRTLFRFTSYLSGLRDECADVIEDYSHTDAVPDDTVWERVESTFREAMWRLAERNQEAIEFDAAPIIDKIIREEVGQYVQRHLGAAEH